MNYYIQGCAAKADKIRAAFENKGYDVTGFDMCNDNILFFTYELEGGANVISTANAKLYTANIIKTHPDYKELELPVEFKDGDIIGFNDCTHNDGRYIDWVGIYRHQSNDFINHQHFFHCVATSKNAFRIGGSWRVFTAYPATKEQRDLLFKKMKEAGYQWDAEKKELRKIQPHYDIANFHVGMPVLVRQDNDCCWNYSVFSRNTGNEYWPFAVCNGVSFTQCIPFNEETKHLLGTTDMCDEQYINW